MNTELFGKALERIKANPRDWAQEFFDRSENPCGAACCIAGHVVELSNVIPTVLMMDVGGAIWAWDPGSAEFEGTVPRIAQRLLEITDGQARWLFDHKRTLEDFERALRHGPDEFDEEEDERLEEELTAAEEDEDGDERFEDDDEGVDDGG